jgi:hypothetical protein
MYSEVDPAEGWVDWRYKQPINSIHSFVSHMHSWTLV